MAREINRLSARTVGALKKPGRHADGGGLYLVVDPSGARRWLFLFRWQGKLKEMGLGGIAAVSLADAREKAAQARKLVGSGVNPIEYRRSHAAQSVSFGEFADQLVGEIQTEFRSEKHRFQWKYTVEKFCAGLRSKPIGDIDTAAVLKILTPLWKEKPETASRVRGRIERILDAASAKGMRKGENPARWRGHLEALLPGRSRLQREHHAAMPYDQVPAFVAELRTKKGIAALALEFTILTAGRSGEVYGATWAEIDRASKVWIIPKERMKAGREHRVPLTPRAMQILDVVAPLGSGGYVFPSPWAKKGAKYRERPLSRLAMSLLLNKRMKRSEVTVHGFRSSFRDWVGETTSFPREVAEAALAHVVGDKVEAAYRRGDALDKRRKLMLAWEEFITNTSTEHKVVPLRG